MGVNVEDKKEEHQQMLQLMKAVEEATALMQKSPSKETVSKVDEEVQVS